MPKPATLTDDAYEALLSERLPGETPSTQVLRLLGTGAPPAKDPMSFASRPRRFTMSRDEHLRQVEQDRDADLA